MTCHNIKSLNIPYIPVKFLLEDINSYYLYFLKILFMFITIGSAVTNKLLTNAPKIFTLNPFLCLILILQSLFSKSDLLFFSHEFFPVSMTSPLSKLKALLVFVFLHFDCFLQGQSFTFKSFFLFLNGL